MYLWKSKLVFVGQWNHYIWCLVCICSLQTLQGLCKDMPTLVDPHYKVLKPQSNSALFLNPQGSFDLWDAFAALYDFYSFSHIGLACLWSSVLFYPACGFMDCGCRMRTSSLPRFTTVNEKKNVCWVLSCSCFVFQHLALAKEYNTDSLRRYSWTPDTMDNVNLVSSPVHSG